jgi:hypothetical protein
MPSPFARCHLILWLLVAPMLAVAVPVAAQGPRGHRERGEAAPLARRNRDFLRALVEDRDSAARFFPRHGDWAWVHRTEYDVGRGITGVWRFRGDEAARVIGRGGVMCGELLYNAEAGSELMEQIFLDVDQRRAWRRVRGHRFVPPGSGARSPLFVEWRREDGAWVVAAIGGASHEHLPMPGHEVQTAVRDRVPGQPLAWEYGERSRWYVNAEPFTFAGMRFVKYGIPRVLPRDQLVRIATLGGIPLYADAGSPRTPDLLHMPLNPGGEFQSFQGSGVEPCR